MSACAGLAANAPSGVAPALRAVDCLANEAAATAFSRLFGSAGSLTPALTILLTLYIAFFAISLLTGRSRVSVSALTPRMMTLGLVLTFATSWLAYQGVVWNLAVGAPDQIAGVLLGAKGSATQLFADRIDIIFAAIAEVASISGGGQGGALQNTAAGSFTPGNLMWLGALLLMLGTVGVLVTARIALAVLLAVGPIFVVFGLFSGTRGLTAGWLRGVVLTAVTPLFVVLGGGLMLELLVPVVNALREGEGIDGRAAMALFMIAAIHIALMAMVLRVVGTMVGSWQVFGLAATDRPGSGSTISSAAAAPSTGYTPDPSSVTPANAVTRRGVGLAVATVVADGGLNAPAAVNRTSVVKGTVVTAPTDPSSLPPLRGAARARGIGSRFQSRSTQVQGMIR
ncbi:MAG: type IV secretion system protein [Brevundimonas sp.]|nr:type IV secretion system protein [Brevundimonas sp.]